MHYSDDFKTVFKQLKKILVVNAAELVCTQDDADAYYLNTPHIMKNNKPLFFGSVQIKKNYVSFHLMPVYVYPELLTNMSAGLQKRMQGKSCFNFREPDAQLFAELAALTEGGLRKYQAAGYLPAASP